MPKNDPIADAVLEVAELLRLATHRLKRALVRPEIDETYNLIERRVRALGAKLAER